MGASHWDAIPGGDTCREEASARSRAGIWVVDAQQGWMVCNAEDIAMGGKQDDSEAQSLVIAVSNFRSIGRWDEPLKYHLLQVRKCEHT